TDGRTPGAGVLRALRRPSPAVRAKPDSGRRPPKPGPAGAPGRPAPGPAPLQELEVLSGRRDEAGTGERVVRVSGGFLDEVGGEPVAQAHRLHHLVHHRAATGREQMNPSPCGSGNSTTARPAQG